MSIFPKAESPWTIDRIADLTRLWNAGLSTRIIDERLGLSKNAVISKADRIGLTPRPSPLKRPYRNRQLNGTKAPKIAASKEVPTPRRFGIEGCLWPTNDGRCGLPNIYGKPYCQKHCDVAYVKASP